MINTDNLKLVTKAELINDSNYLCIYHYGTMIFSHCYSDNSTIINYNCSPTSNKQIKEALRVIGKTLDQCVDIHKGKKNNFSGDQC